MAILISNDNKELIATCNCGCEDSVHIKVENISDDYFAFVSYMNGNFYTDQNSCFTTLKNKIKKIWSIIRNKDYYYSDIVLTKKEFEDFKQFLNQC